MPETNTLSTLIDKKLILEALSCQGAECAAGKYNVWGSEDYYVDTEDMTCDCPFFVWNERPCKHLVYCLLREGHIEVMRLLTQYLQEV